MIRLLLLPNTCCLPFAAFLCFDPQPPLQQPVAHCRDGAEM